MKKSTQTIILLFALLFAGSVGSNLSAQTKKRATTGKAKTSSKTTTKASAKTTDPGVVINGVRWATCNVDEPGTFAPTPESAGKFYQWNRKKAWPATGSVNGWDSTDPEGNTWATENDPSPAGWRVPEIWEIEKLFDENKVSNQWITFNGVYGRRFTDRENGNSIFLPAAGSCNNDDGSLDDVGNSGYYWSSTGYGSYYAYLLYFSRGIVDLYDDYDRSCGLSVRPVAVEQPQPLVQASPEEQPYPQAGDVMDKAPSSDNFVLINGVRWATRNVDEPGTFAPTPESAGKFYQWNRKKAWPATGNVNGWDSTNPEGNTWATENDPSPAGWRVPTSDEIHKLIYDKSNVKSQWATLSGVYGRRFIDINNGNSIFLPAAGNRGLDDGPLLNVDYYGGYWSSTGLDSYLAYFLSFGSDRADQIVIFRSLGFSVRPVADE